MDDTGFIDTFLAETRAIAEAIDQTTLTRLVDALVDVRARGGRLFVLGVGGSAANASHAVNDFRKLCAIEAYAPSDNVAEFSARVNDDGWATVFSGWLEVSRLTSDDLVLIFSVGGGDEARNISPNLVAALQLARARACPIAGIVGRDGGATARLGDPVVVVPTVHPERVTPHTEAFQAVLWHLLVSHPRLQRRSTTWEQLA